MKIKKQLRRVRVVLAASMCATIAYIQNANAAEPAEQKVLAFQIPENQLAWGDADPSGLELGAWHFPAKTSLVLCVIRNQGKDSVRYNTMYLGDSGMGVFSVFARPQGVEEWKEVPLKRQGPAHGIGPSAYKVVDLLPGQRIPNYSREDKYKRERPATAAPLNILPPGYHITEATQKALAGTPLPPHTFTVRLVDYDWPNEWTGMIELRVEQTMISDKDRPSWEGTLKSGVVRVPLRMIRAERLPGTDPITEVVLEKGNEGETLTTEEFKHLIQTVEPVQGIMDWTTTSRGFIGMEEYVRLMDPANGWYSGRFSTPEGIYQFKLGIHGVGRLIAPGGTWVLFKFNRGAEKR